VSAARLFATSAAEFEGCDGTIGAVCCVGLPSAGGATAVGDPPCDGSSHTTAATTTTRPSTGVSHRSRRRARGDESIDIAPA
jgi:hypothetical protein